jgi:hypothetical protein
VFPTAITSNLSDPVCSTKPFSLLEKMDKSRLGGANERKSVVVE